MSLQLSSLFLVVAFLLLPGFLWMKVHKAYGKKTQISQFDIVLNSFIYAIVSYLILFLIYHHYNAKLHLLDISADNPKVNVSLIAPEIAEAVGVGLTLSLLWLYVSRLKLVTRLLQIIRATDTYGDEDVWDYTFNSSSVLSQFVHFRDFEQRVVYAGDVRVFSETGQMRELVLEGVSVYDFEGTELYQIPALYLSRSPENIHIEFPGQQGPVTAETDTIAKEEACDDQSFRPVPVASKLALIVGLSAMVLFVGRRLAKATSGRVA